MNEFEATELLELNRCNLTKQQYKVLYGQVISGDTNGAIKGLKKLLRRKNRNNE